MTLGESVKKVWKLHKSNYFSTAFFLCACMRMRANERWIFHETQKLYWTIYCPFRSITFCFRQFHDSAFKKRFYISRLKKKTKKKRKENSSKNDLISWSAVKFSKLFWNLYLKLSLLRCTCQVIFYKLARCFFTFRK